MFGGDVNREEPCAPDRMWVRADTAAAQVPGIQHIHDSVSLDEASAGVAAATYSDHDFPRRRASSSTRLSNDRLLFHSLTVSYGCKAE